MQSEHPTCKRAGTTDDTSLEAASCDVNQGAKPNAQQLVGSSPVRSAQVVIVGAGLAGLAAAQRLHELGLEDVIVLDAMDRVGGRVHTINHSEYLLELGAQWLHGADENPLYQWLTDKNMLDDFEDASLGFEGLFCTNTGQLIDSKLAREIIELLVEGKISLSKQRYANIDGATDSASLVFRQQLDRVITDNERFRRYDRHLIEAIFEWFLRFETIENGCNSMDEVSIASYTDWTDWGDGTLLNFKQGYRSLLSWFCDQIPAKRWIQLNSEVLSIEMLKPPASGGVGGWTDELGRSSYKRPMLVGYRDSSSCAAQTATNDSIAMGKAGLDSGTIECDHVIVTVSLGFLKQNHETLFKPRLPRIKRDLIDSIGFGTVNKIVLQFERPFWNNNDHGIKLVWSPDGADEFPHWARDILAFDVVRRQPNLLIGWIGGRGAKEMELESDQNIGNTCLRLFERFLPNDYDRPSRLVACFCSRWHSNPYTRGSYSFQSMKSFDQKVDKLHEPVYSGGGLTLSACEQPHKLLASLSAPRLPRILFAGEATAGKLYSTTHGAIISGWREADRLVDSLAGANKSNIQQVNQLIMPPKM